MRQLLKKETPWEWTPEIDGDFKNLKKEITESPYLAHFDPKKDNYVTTDACNTGVGATLWQKREKHSDRSHLLVDVSLTVRGNMLLMN